jgi:hypothetical protein
MFEKWAKFNRSKSGITLLFVCSICMLVLAIFAFFKNIDHLARIMFFDVGCFVLSVWGIITAVARMRDLKAER